MSGAILQDEPVGWLYSRIRAWNLLDLLGLTLFVVLLPEILGSDLFLGYTSIANTVLVWMLITLSYNLLLGYTGLLSFGHSVFLGTGVYTVAIILANTEFGQDYYVFVAILAIVISGLIGYLIGRLIIHKGNIYFAMLTIAFTEVFYFVINADPGGLTNGSDGISHGVLPPWIEFVRGEMFLSLGFTRFNFYWIFAAVFIGAVYLLLRIVRSPFGRTLLAIRENELLARSIGIDSTRYKLYSFTISAMFVGLGGVLLELVNQGAGIIVYHWSTSGDIVIMTILGGMGSFVGPMVGALTWQAGSQYILSFQVLNLPFIGVEVQVAEYVRFWKLLFGAFFVIVVMVSPEEGIWGFAKNAVARLYQFIEDLLSEEDTE